MLPKSNLLAKTRLLSSVTRLSDFPFVLSSPMTVTHRWFPTRAYSLLSCVSLTFLLYYRHRWPSHTDDFQLVPILSIFRFPFPFFLLFLSYCRFAMEGGFRGVMKAWGNGSLWDPRRLVEISRFLASAISDFSFFFFLFVTSIISPLRLHKCVDYVFRALLIEISPEKSIH